MDIKKIGNILEQIYTLYHKPKYIKPDPLQFLYDYQKKEELEIVGLIAASFAIGRVDKIIEVYEDRAVAQRYIHINYGKETEFAVKEIQTILKKSENKLFTDKVTTRFLAIKLLENDSNVSEIVSECKNANKINEKIKEQKKILFDHFKEDSETIITDARYGFIAGILKETYKEGNVDRFKTTKAIDVLVTHKYLGFPIFLLFLYLMFVSTFKLGEYPMGWIEWLVGETANLFQSFMPDGMLKDLIVDGIIQGVGSVIIFLPNILILFLFISLMEDTGYMARVAFIMDKLMHKIGLHGKSFIPMLMGFGCNVPAVMATRTIENKNDRLLTMLINPFMSCSARLPIYLLIVGTVFPDNAGTVLFSIYFIGIIIAVLMAILFKKIIFKSKEAPFVMELPPYRIPTVKVVSKHVWQKGRSYLKKMGGIILIASIIIWALGYFPKHENLEKEYQVKIDKIQTNYENSVKSLPIEEQNTFKEKCDAEISSLEREFNAQHQAKSFIGKIGHFCEPVMRPLGFDWKMTVGIISGVSAKEIVVSTLGVLYQSEEEDKLSDIMKNVKYESGDKIGQKVFTPVTALAFLLFSLIYFPCIATIAAVKKESGSWKWALFMVGYTTTLAWIVAFGVS